MLNFAIRMQKIQHTVTIPIALAGKRFDQALAELLPQYSRAKLQEWIKAEQVTANGAKLKTKQKVHGQELVEILATVIPQQDWTPQQIALDVVYEDSELIVVNKEAGLVVHPAAGNPDGTLANALLHYAPELELLPRAGLVHRLDKDTSGLLLIARNLIAHNKLVNALQAREIKREYEAVAHGVMTGGGKIDAPIARDPRSRVKMAVIESGKPALTHYRVLQRLSNHTHLKINLETGRTHQIRVHMAYIHYPLVGDSVYGGRQKWPPFPRQALHAKRLELMHPTTNKKVVFQCELPKDMAELLRTLI